MLEKEDIDKLHHVVSNLHVIQGSAQGLYESLGNAINNLETIKNTLKNIIDKLEAEQNK